MTAGRRFGVALLAGTLALTGCGDDDAATSTTTTSTVSTSTTGDGPPPIEALDVGELPVPPAGEGRLVLGTTLDTALRIDECVIDDDAEPEGAEPVVLVSATASGRVAPEGDVTVEVVRFRSDAAETTITDTITVTERRPVDGELRPVRAWQAQRFEVGGLVTDGRDPDASAPLLQLRLGVVRARGRYAPPGNFLDDGGVVEGALVLSCDAGT